MSSQTSVKLGQMSPEAISQMRQSVSSEIEFMSESANSLKDALRMFDMAKQAAGKLGECRPEQDTLIPLTNTLFMKGQIIEPEKMIVDIGTGYYVEMKSERAVDFYKRKGEFVQNQLAAIKKVIFEKQATLDILTDALQKKIAAYANQQQTAAPTAVSS